MRSLHVFTSVIGRLLGQHATLRPDPPHRRPGPLYPIRGLAWTAEFIASKAFLQTPEWKRARYDALRASDGRCQLCGRSKHELPPGEYLNVDHIFPRKTHPHLALDLENLQVTDSDCNIGKGNRHADDWRRPKARGGA
ncbi:MAG: hypothetical protein BGO49_24585 [Planctomycetales bacterium 71-10]|nr:MAG: hypothetical protein BGO49_24585 [Planctomycetales bacterium 71-10]